MAKKKPRKYMYSLLIYFAKMFVGNMILFGGSIVAEGEGVKVVGGCTLSRTFQPEAGVEITGAQFKSLL